MLRRSLLRRLLVLLPAIIGCGPASDMSATFRFASENDRLFAIEAGDSYGTERGAIVSDDAGTTWNRFEVPNRTIDLAGNGKTLFAVTSEGGIWKQSSDDKKWIQLDKGPSRYLFDALAARDGRLVVTRFDNVTIYSADGRPAHRFGMPNAADAGAETNRFFVRSHFADENQRFVIVEGNPFLVFVIDLESNEMTPWTNGLSVPPEGEAGPASVRRHGDRFLVRQFDGIYAADGLHEPWRPLVMAGSDLDLTLASFCRDLITYDAAADQWLFADDAGVHLMQGDKRLRTVFEDITAPNDYEGVSDDHDLITGLTSYGSDYYISFARLKNGCIGVKLKGDLSSWEALKLTTQ